MSNCPGSGGSKAALFESTPPPWRSIVFGFGTFWSISGPIAFIVMWVQFQFMESGAIWVTAFGLILLIGGTIVSKAKASRVHPTTGNFPK